MIYVPEIITWGKGQCGVNPKERFKILSNPTMGAYSDIDKTRDAGLKESNRKLLQLHDEHKPREFEERYCGPTTTTQWNDVIQGHIGKYVYWYERFGTPEKARFIGLFELKRVEMVDQVTENGENVCDTADVCILFLIQLHESLYTLT